jgi:signal transduction histidine kinase
LGTYLLVGFLVNKHQTVLAGFIFTLLVNFGFFGVFIASMVATSIAEALESYIYICFMMGLAIIFAGAFIHRWAAFSLAALDSVLMLFLTQIMAPQAGPLFSVHIFWWLLATSTWLYETTLSRSLARLQQSRAELESLVLARTHKLQETVGKLEKAQQDLQVKNEELESFSYSVSHDLRAPLRAIDGYSEALEEDYRAQLPSEGKHILTRIHENTHRMDQLIQDLLMLSRLDRAQINRRTVYPGEIVREVVDDLKKEIPDQVVEVTLDDLPPCQADPILLRQVYTNLLSNAFKFTRQRSQAQVLVSSTASSEGPVYLVKDNGVGFDMQQAHKLFSPFQRMHSQDDYEGTGVGLSIVRRIVQQHGGRVWVEAAVEQGATFYFTLGEPEQPGSTLEPIEETR